MNKHIPTAGARNHRPQFGDGNGAQQSIDTAEDPDSDKKFCSGKLGGDFAGSAQDAHPDSSANGHRQTKADAKNPQELAVISRRFVTVWLERLMEVCWADRSHEVRV